MCIAILHLSDIHIKKSAKTSIERASKIAAALRGLQRSSEVSAVLVAFSGDIAYSGTHEQYIEAKKFKDRLFAELSVQFSGASLYFFAVPGNHDCDFSDDQNQAREIMLNGLLRSTQSQALEPATIVQLTAHQKPFFDFLDAEQSLSPIDANDRFCRTYEIDINGAKIAVSCFNTAISSAIHEKAGSLHLPTENLKRVAQLKNADYSIAVFHHPYNWLTPDSKNRFQSFSEKRADLILTGHEHISGHYRKSNYDPGTLAYIEGGVLAEDDSGKASAFNAILLAVDRSEELVCEFTWEGDFYEKTEVSGGWKPFRKARSTRDFELNHAFGESLIEIGMPFSHPSKPKLDIDDIYITPDASEFVINADSKEKDRSGVVKGRSLIPTLIERKKAVVIGRERSGKSTLAKIIFRKYYADGYTPVLIEGAHIKKSDLADLPGLVRRHAALHYDNPKLDLFDQYDRDKLVVIVDDFDQAPELGPRGRLKCLEALSRDYQRVLIFGDDLMRIEEIASGHLGSSAIKSFSHFELREFGFVLRSQLLDKWYGINAEYITDEDTLRKKVQNAERIIDDMMKRSYLPSYPQFILTILQGADGAQGIDSNSGSYGYLYQVLITDRLSQSHKTISLDRKLGYLVELAYYLFKRRHTELSETEYEAFHLRYCNDYPVIDRKLIFSALEDAGILEIYDRHYRFKYKYFYYYSVAQYFSRHIDEEGVRGEVKDLCKDFDKEEQANIWLFLIHQSRSQFLLDTIAQHARDFFSDLLPINFDGDVSFLDALYDKVPALVYVDKSVDEIRQERRERLDREAAEPEHVDPIDGEASEEGAKLIELIKKLKAAVRTLEVMGQIVKNFAPSLKGNPRYTLVKECYDLGLRVINRFFKMWQETGDEFIAEVLDVVLEKNTSVETKQELEAAVKGFIFHFCETVAVNMIKRVSQAVSAHDLAGTYAEVYSKNPTKSYRMIDVALKLDNPSFPMGEVFALNEELKGEIFCKRMLSRLTVDHFYIFKTKDQLKQQVCEKLGIEMKRFREIDYKTSDTKRIA